MLRQSRRRVDVEGHTHFVLIRRRCSQAVIACAALLACYLAWQRYSSPNEKAYLVDFHCFKIPDRSVFLDAASKAALRMPGTL